MAQHDTIRATDTGLSGREGDLLLLRKAEGTTKIFLVVAVRHFHFPPPLASQQFLHTPSLKHRMLSLLLYTLAMPPFSLVEDRKNTK